MFESTSENEEELDVGLGNTFIIFDAFLLLAHYFLLD